MFLHTVFQQVTTAMIDAARFIRLAAKAVLLSMLVLFLTGCQTQQTEYRWGIYEDHVYADYAKPGNRSPKDAAMMLEADVAQTLESNQKVPPGVYAHLAYLNYLDGDIATATTLFEQEKASFPESAVFIDTLLKNLQGAQQ